MSSLPPCAVSRATRASRKQQQQPAPRGRLGSRHAREATAPGKQSPTACRRLLEASGIGLEDYILNADQTIADFCEIVGPKVQGLRHLLDSLQKAAAALDDARWQAFGQLPFLRQHIQDGDAHGQLLPRVDASWKAILEYPRRCGSTAQFLFVGLSPPTEALCSLLADRCGWIGYAVAPRPFSTACASLPISYVQLDPASHCHEEEAALLTQDGGGQIPEPEAFRLVYLDFSVDLSEVEADSEEDAEVGTQSQSERMPVTSEDDAAPSSPSRGLHHLAQQAIGTAARSYGILGVTRAAIVQRRLRGLRNILSIGLARLAGKGTLVVCWQGIPFHPVLAFLVSLLRPLFESVSLTTDSRSAASFETYVVCARFNRGGRSSGDDPQVQPLSASISLPTLPTLPALPTPDDPQVQPLSASISLPTLPTLPALPTPDKRCRDDERAERWLRDGPAPEVAGLSPSPPPPRRQQRAGQQRRQLLEETARTRRSVPTLSGSFGAAPGAPLPWPATKQLAERFPLIEYGFQLGARRAVQEYASATSTHWW
eukprot:TRINITY_DN25005_c0_g1_i4.p1 TRINITY_DN25005_c0_g1~~TRINITY_DN25005_c0_g1_i4.p1  ORF type:complete len:551 (-),score=98.72 TRINITY_DN25005_c0_g1_i4:48-1673(-)